ncbi:MULTISPECIES: spore coat protein U domain-containing protein [unclassified Pseudomonas]|uniref:Csu type fimbrial protein n=1 Tax=unclassified Pseudomonas TaxID=196821 RepID=UPI002448BB84|nr:MULTISPECIES: spore coat protein U domain-containing protein [unclassified Pseudomonas]MDG9924071.1 spore coat protein U domain-containing protein [Pseudomonas sp. GD04045]MDH0036501.1 spore coat protein U domain-containing protein [Pseudomonas sp. GD04019]
MNRRNLLVLLLVLGLLGAAPARAACSTYTAAVNLGTASSLALRNVAQQAAAGAGLSCGGVLTAFSGAYVRVTLNSAAPLLLKDGNGNQIPFQIYQDAGFTQALPSGTAQQLGVINLLTIGGTSSAIALYFRTNLGPNVPAGTYTASVTLRWDWAICVLGALNICAWERSPGLTQPCVVICGTPNNWGSGSLATINITLVVTKACQIDSLPAVNFGTHALISQFGPQVQSLAVTCTNSEGFTLGFDDGQHYQASWRRLANGGQYMRYHLYRPNSSVIWNTTTPLSAAGTGDSQSFSYQAIIDPSQPNVPAGTYIDNVLLIISY